MLFDSSILNALEAIGAQPWSGEVWRVIFGDRDPISANRTGARWNPPDTGALYASLDREVVLTELDHLRDLQTPPAKRAGYRLYQLQVRLARLLDLRDPDLLVSLGVPTQTLLSDEHGQSRQVGGAAAWLGCDGLLVPSVRANGDNLIVFVDQQDPDAEIEVISAHEIHD